mgnify:CR=1 FL=1
MQFLDRSNGWICAPEISGQDTIALYSAYHALPETMEFIHGLESRLDRIRYVNYKDDAWRGGSKTVYVKGRDIQRFGDVEVIPYETRDSGNMGSLGYLIKTDGLSIFYPNFFPEDIDAFKKEIDFLADLDSREEAQRRRRGPDALQLPTRLQADNGEASGNSGTDPVHPPGNGKAARQEGGTNGTAKNRQPRRLTRDAGDAATLRLGERLGAVGGDRHQEQLRAAAHQMHLLPLPQKQYSSQGHQRRYEDTYSQ